MHSGIERDAKGGLLFPVESIGEDFMGANTGETAFERVRTQLKARLGGEVYASWFARLKLEESSKDLVRLSVPTAFLRSWINSHYLDLVAELWRQELPQLLRVEIMVRSAANGIRVTAAEAPALRQQSREPAVAAAPAQLAPLQPPKPSRTPEGVSRNGVVGSPLDPKYTLETFVEGPSNRVALAAAKAVAESASRFNPLFIHASVGLGKTHLLQAVAASAAQRNPSARIVYLTAEYFMWRFATAIRDNNALTLKEQLRDIDLLIIDDMQFLQGKSIQHEFCHLINMLLDGARQVVVAADRPPAELESLEPRVRSRLVGGVALEIGAPDHAMRLAMLRQRLEGAQAKDPSLAIGDDILEHVAANVTSSGRELEGAFNQLVFRQSFEPNITLERVEDLLRHMIRSNEPKRPRIEDIQRIVARHFNVSKTELLSNRRTRTIVKPRQIAMYLAKVMTPRSLPEIGRRFGGRDHTTVLHAVRKIEDLSDHDEKLAQELELLRRLISDSL